ncbi:helix-turn-helix domain-containing protein [Specibacter sp. NPDC057265]|uniref:helix-turn-helix domain-containing protein n=1 Tax=Specibacter sp. NPDC057265 TaxID=3346075 RepID=UPI003627E6C7
MVRVPLTAEEVRRGKDLGAALRLARGQRTMVEVALGAGISVETLRKIETGRSPSPEFFTIARICAELGLSMDAFSTFNDEASPAALAS